MALCREKIFHCRSISEFDILTLLGSSDIHEKNKQGNNKEDNAKLESWS